MGYEDDRPTDRRDGEPRDAATLRCALCGNEFDPAGARSPCGHCPLSHAHACVFSCCPRCGYAMPVEEKSALVRIFDRLFPPRRTP